MSDSLLQTIPANASYGEDDTAIAGNAVINMNLVPRVLAIPDAADACLTFGAALSTTNEAKEYDSLGDSSGTKIDFHKASKTLRTSISDGNGLQVVKEVLFDKARLKTDIELVQDKKMNILKDSSIRFEDDDASDEMYWELRRNSESDNRPERLAIRHSGQTEKRVLDATTDADIIGTEGPDAVGNYPGPTVDVTLKFKADPAHQWQAGQMYVFNAETGLEISDHKVFIHGDVSVIGKLVVPVGTAANFLDVSNFDKDVTAVKDVEILESLQNDHPLSSFSTNTLYVKKDTNVRGAADAAKETPTVQIQHSSEDGIGMHVSKGRIEHNGSSTVLKDHVEVTVTMDGGVLSGTEGVRIEQASFTSDQQASHPALEVAVGRSALQKTSATTVSVLSKSNFKTDSSIVGSLDLDAETLFKNKVRFTSDGGFNPYRKPSDALVLPASTIYFDENGFMRVARHNTIQYSVGNANGWQGPYYGSSDVVFKGYTFKQELSSEDGSPSVPWFANSEQQAYIEGQAAVDSSDNLVLTLEKNSSGHLVSSRLSHPYTMNGYDKNYFALEVKFKGKLPKSLGANDAVLPDNYPVWPAFWLLGDQALPWPSNGEIDVMEWSPTRTGLGQATKVSSALHWSHEGNYAHATSHYPSISDVTDTEYEYMAKIISTADYKIIAMYRDNVCYGLYDISDKPAFWEPDSSGNKKYDIIINLAYGGSYTTVTDPVPDAFKKSKLTISDFSLSAGSPPATKPFIPFLLMQGFEGADMDFANDDLFSVNAQQYAGFYNTNDSLYPIDASTQDITITFDAKMKDGDQVDVFFQLENRPYANGVAPSLVIISTSATINSSSYTQYSVVLTADGTNSDSSDMRSVILKAGLNKQFYMNNIRITQQA